jgi:hypothetical protein
MTQLHCVVGLLVAGGLLAACNDQPPAKGAPMKPAEVAVPITAAQARGDRKRVPAKLTDDDRAVIAYLDAWDVIERELDDGFVAARKRATATRMDIARRRTADVPGACAEIAAVLARHDSWHREHPVPAALQPNKASAYLSSLIHRQTGNGEDLDALIGRLGGYLDRRDDFERRSTFKLKQQLENLQCPPGTGERWRDASGDRSGVEPSIDNLVPRP